MDKNEDLYFNIIGRLVSTLWSHLQVHRRIIQFLMVRRSTNEDGV